MSYDKLLGQRRVKPYRARPQEVEQLLQVAARDLATAEKILPEDLDWAFNIVYNESKGLDFHPGVAVTMGWGTIPGWNSTSVKPRARSNSKR